MTDKLQLIKDDPWLEPYAWNVNNRLEKFRSTLKNIEQSSESLYEFANAHEYYGFQFDKRKNGWYYREWAPAAHSLFLTGDFNEWNRSSHPLSKNDKGDWEIFLPFNDYEHTFVHASKVKVHIVADNGKLDRIPVYIRRVIQDPVSYDFSGQLWFEASYGWSDQKFSREHAYEEPFIYECHTGMAQEKEGLGTYLELQKDLLPRIKNLGYNTIQLMAVMEHPYYGSFGYHVSNFFAPSSRFGTPEDLKSLINAAHEMGIAVIMDIVHSHAVKNIAEGLDMFDGSDHLYFHSGPRGYHPAWDSKLFNYGKTEVLKFLLSNLRFWLEEYHFDGFRFDGVTSMLYTHHGYTTFDHYDKYFKHEVDPDAITFMQLANELIHSIHPDGLSIAEDVSGMPGLCRSVEDGGVGFDYRLGMGIPDYWIKILKEKSDEEWNLNEIWGVLNNRRYKEKTIAYCESHDQALVGDKTLAFWLMDKEMYYHMLLDDNNLIIERGMALHKMIRLITISLGGEGYLNFIGNEFGHPEWIDFPRQGNNWSYKYARRQWTLADSKNLKYQYLQNFDKAMIHTIAAYRVLPSAFAKQINVDTDNNVLIFERNNMIFIFNFHVNRSIFGYQFRAPQSGSYQIVLNSDDKDFGGFGRIDNAIVHHTDKEQNLALYITQRTGIILKKV